MINDTVQVIKDDSSKGCYLLEVNGFILSEKEMLEVANGIHRFLAVNNPATINKMNDEILLQYEKLNLPKEFV